MQLPRVIKITTQRLSFGIQEIYFSLTPPHHIQQKSVSKAVW